MNWLNNVWDTKDEDIEIHNTPRPRSGHLDVERIDYKDPADVRKLLEEFDGDGWVMFTHKAANIEKGKPIGEEGQFILAAESVDQNKSIHIRQSKDGWTCWTITSTEKTDQWIFEHSFLRMPQGTLTYEVSWAKDTHDPQGVFRPYLSRLKAVVPQRKKQ